MVHGFERTLLAISMERCPGGKGLRALVSSTPLDTRAAEEGEDGHLMSIWVVVSKK